MKLKDLGSMTARDVFGLIVRLIGLRFLYEGLMAVPAAFSGIFPVFPHLYIRNVVPSLILVMWPLGVAYWLVRGAPPLMQWAFPEPRRETESVEAPLRTVESCSTGEPGS